jgi:hypothetical protein
LAWAWADAEPLAGASDPAFVEPPFDELEHALATTKTDATSNGMPLRARIPAMRDPLVCDGSGT